MSLIKLASEAQRPYNSSVGKNFNREQNAVCVLLFVSFLAGIVGVYFNRVGGIRIGRYAIFAAIALVPVTMLYLRKLNEVLDALLYASLGGLGVGAGIGFIGIWYVYDNPSRLWVGPQWLTIGLIFLIYLVPTLKNLKPEPGKAGISDEEIERMTPIERLRYAEKSFSNEEVFGPLKSEKYQTLAWAIVVVSLILAICYIATAESTKERLTALVVFTVAVPVFACLALWLRRQLNEFNSVLGDINVHRNEILIKVRAEIAELEASEGGELPPPTETA